MNCKICNSPSQKLFKKLVLNKYDVLYFKCPLCGFIQTEDPYWLPESYKSPITKGDIGYLTRNLSTSYITTLLINLYFNKTQFVDYGGGYGLFVRIMRDNGFDFYLEDKYCQNIFAENHEYINASSERFELLTAFEVFEHIPNPIDEIEKMFKFSDNILFSTKICPTNLDDLENWWYLSPYHGQHISLYTTSSLDYIAKKFGCKYITDGQDYHLFTKKRISKYIFSLITNYKFSFLYFHLTKKSRKSLSESDYKSILST